MKKATLLLCLVLTLATGCKREVVVDDTNALKIGYLPTIDIIPYLVAQELGIYDTLGLDLRLIEMQTAVERDTLYAQQAIQGALLSTIEMLQHNAEGESYVPTLTHLGLHFVVATNDTLINEPADLKYGCIAVARASVMAYFAEKVRDKWGFDEDDVAFPCIFNDTLRTRMVCDGQVEGAVIPYRFVTQAYSDSVKIFARSHDFTTPLAVTAFADTTLVQRREDIEKLIVGYNRAIEHMSNMVITQWWPTSMGELLLMDEINNIPRFAPTRQLLTTEAIELLQWMADNDMVSQKMVSSYKPDTTVSEIYKVLQ